MNRLIKLLKFLPFLLFFLPLFSNASAPLNLDVEPSIFRINLKQGESWSSNIRIDNHNKSDLSYAISLVDFKKDDNGSYAPVLESLRSADNVNKSDSYDLQLSGWITVDKNTVDIKQGKDADISFKVDVPEDIEPGEYRAAILVSLIPDRNISTGSSLSVSSFISSVLDISVTGNDKKELRIKNFSSSQSVYENPDVTLILDIENKGYVRVVPQGFIDIKDVFGKKVGTVMLSEHMMAGIQQANSKNSSYTLNWKPSGTIFGLGPYVATVNLSYGGLNGKELSSSSMFWILPIKILMALAVAILILLIIGDRFAKLYIKRVLKRRNR